MRLLLAIVLLLTFAFPAFAQQSITDRLSAMEATNAAMLARQARMQSDIADLKVSVQSIGDKIDAMARAKGLTAQTTKTWDGQTTTFTQGAASQQQTYSSSQSYGESSMSSRPRLFGGRILGGLRAGGCASGG